MIGAQMAPHNGEWVVSCAEHDWRWQVKTEGHALNLLRKHDREWEHQAAGGGPAALDLTAAARYLLVCHTDQDTDGPPDQLPHATAAASAYYATLDLWEKLTGLEGEPALAYAREVAAHQTTAVVPPWVDAQ